jgi:hypothetical protein
MNRVYFIRRADGEGPVKIGYSWSPPERLKTLMTWAPYPLEVVATIEGGHLLERRFHNLFRDDHSHREWFRPSARLDAVIAEVAAGVFDIETLPPPKMVGSLVRTCWSEETKLAVRVAHDVDRLRRAGVHTDIRFHRWTQKEDWLRMAQAICAEHAPLLSSLKSQPRKRAA